MDESTKNGIIKAIVIMVLAALIVVSVFVILTRNRKGTNTTTEELELTEVQKITTIDLSKSYPKTPPTVVDLYAHTMKVLYKENYTDEEFEKMASVLSGIFDSEFLQAQQSWPSGLKSEVEQKKKDDCSIPKYEVLTSDLQEKRDNGEEIANVVAKFHIRTGTHTTPYNYLFVLRKDSNGLWKIMGWTVSEATDTEQ
ncbi:DUF6715 family protein [Butyrivibrio sp. INlla16]|uniref:DUF6715 family protein n=1 Tax=Butyrivibrio sp. INlla16 TaxID=1520807 RepID=UPI0008804C48|nr:DUF6715 family protein [Butyrivibrio sp. INlla16]SDB46433.1 hypothetical protein SAMN02910263_02273 [Butyrivibrio sp. INlla16]